MLEKIEENPWIAATLQWKLSSATLMMAVSEVAKLGKSLC